MNLPQVKIMGVVANVSIAKWGICKGSVYMVKKTYNSSMYGTSFYTLSRIENGEEFNVPKRYFLKPRPLVLDDVLDPRDWEISIKTLKIKSKKYGLGIKISGPSFLKAFNLSRGFLLIWQGFFNVLS